MFDTVVLDGEFELVVPEEAESSVVWRVQAADYYTGETVITPTQETQTLVTTGKLIPADIVINPIPNNYGLITWDGTVLTVS